MTKWKIGLAAASVALSTIGFSAAAQEYPAKAVELVIPWTPGSASDLAARMLAQHAEKTLGQPITPVNEVGGNGAVAWNRAAKARPDGYTITMVTFDILTNQAMGAPLAYDSFDYLLQFSHQPMGIFVHKGSPYHTLQDLVTAAKGKPGQIKVATTSLGGILHQAVHLVEKRYDVKFNVVPFKGTPEILAATMGRHVDADVNTITLPSQHVKAGNLRMLLSFGEQRLPEYPDVPSIKELGISQSGFESWRAIAIPKGVPAQVRSKLEEAFRTAYNSPEFKQMAQKANYDLQYRTNDELKSFLAVQYPTVVQTLTGLGYAKK